MMRDRVPTRSCAWPKVVLDRSESMASKFGWLARFCASALKRRLAVSVSLKVLWTPRSRLTNLGPWKTFLPSVPKRSNKGPDAGYPGMTNNEFGVPTKPLPVGSHVRSPTAQAPATPKLALQEAISVFAGTHGAPQPI